MKKVLLVLGIIMLGLIAFFIFGQPGKDRVTIKNIENDGIPVIKIEEDRKIPVETEFPFTMEESEVQDAIHSMSHQKVEAKPKWGFLPMTDERINRLIDVVGHNKSEYGESTEVYLNILIRWSNNEISRVDQDHNIIWSMQGGTIGRATGILTPEQELAYIKKHFKVKDYRP